MATTREPERYGDPRNWGRRTRFHGRGRRGMPNRADTDGADLDLAIRELQSARADLLRAYALEPVDAEARREQREAIKIALAKIALATRFADAVVLRRGAPTGDQEHAEQAAKQTKQRNPWRSK